MPPTQAFMAPVTGSITIKAVWSICWVYLIESMGVMTVSLSAGNSRQDFHGNGFEEVLRILPASLISLSFVSPAIAVVHGCFQDVGVIFPDQAFADVILGTEGFLQKG